MSEMPFRNKIIQGDTLEVLKQMPSDYVDTIVTSPPYWGLRDYGEETRTIWDGNKNCEHQWGEYIKKQHSGRIDQINSKDTVYSHHQNIPDKKVKLAFCSKCGAWYGQLGLEPTLDLYIKHLLQVTAELKRVLKPTGVMFWNHGDCYGGNLSAPNQPKLGKRDPYSNFPRVRARNRVPKCLCLQNYRLILQMIDEQEWIFRNDIIWNKPNHMPSSVKDRFANAYEPVFMLVKQSKPQYYYNVKTGLMADRKPKVLKEGIDWDWKEIGGDYSESDTKIPPEEAEKLNSPRARVYRDKKYKKVSYWKSLSYWFDLDAVRKPHTTNENRPYGIVREREFGYNTEYPEIRRKTLKENYKASGMRNAPEPGEPNAFNPAGKNPGDVMEVPLERLSPDELGYIAGLFDGEGSVVIRKVSGNHNFLAVIITNTNKEILNWVQYKTGLGKLQIKRHKLSTKETWDWIVLSHKAAEFLSGIYPWLQIKKEQAKTALEFQTLVLPAGQKLEDWAKKRREELLIEAQSLNKGSVSKSTSPEPNDIWRIPTAPFPMAHFATFPPKLIEPMIKSSCPQWICKKCGKARVRISKTEQIIIKDFKDKGKAKEVLEAKDKRNVLPRTRTGLETRANHKTIGWTDCGCNAGFRAGIVLDPFGGAGTTGVQAKKLGRSYIIIDIKAEYCEMSRKRILNTQGTLL